MSESSTTHGAPSWIEHHGAKPEEARRFYETVIGWTIGDLPMKDGSSYPGIVIGDGPVGGISPHPDAQGSWLLYLTVDDVDARYQKAIGEGAEGVSEPMTVAGVGRMATIRDPFGASISLITYEPNEG